jgi:hypothetical protein
VISIIVMNKATVSNHQVCREKAKLAQKCPQKAHPL